MDADPLVANESQPTQTMAAMVRADERLKTEFALITLPVLILHGTKDEAAKPSGSQFFYDTAGSADNLLRHGRVRRQDPETLRGRLTRFAQRHRQGSGDG